jgi:phosphohistidine phosphatase
MILYVMRHGAAEDWGPGGDWTRPLTPAGLEASRRVAQALFSLRGRGLDRVLCSPALRARQTAQAVLEVLAACAPPTLLEAEVDSSLRPEAEPPLDLAQSLQSLETQDALLVGHWPWVEALIAKLCAPGQELPRFCTAYLVGVESRSGRLVHPVDPRSLDFGSKG